MKYDSCECEEEWDDKLKMLLVTIVEGEKKVLI
jgi:hypothetical protein